MRLIPLSNPPNPFARRRVEYGGSERDDGQLDAWELGDWELGDWELGDWESADWESADWGKSEVARTALDEAGTEGEVSRKPATQRPGNQRHSAQSKTPVSPRGQGLRVFADHSRSILSKNDSPDVPLGYSVNPYRGCLHGCAYCYARPGHEYLGFGAGSDFERIIVIKPDAAKLLREALRRKTWRHEQIVFSGVTDCYQPLEATYQLTLQCLRVCVEERNPVAIITKSALIERDTSLLLELARVAGVAVTISIPFADDEMARKLEPYATPPSRRFKTVERLSLAGLDVGVNVAPVIPGLSDSQIPEIVERAAKAGAKRVGMVLLRLPGSVAQVFEQRLSQHYPLAVAKVLARTREVRGGKLNDPRFGTRMTGTGDYAGAIAQLMRVSAARFGLAYGEFSPSREPSAGAKSSIAQGSVRGSAAEISAPASDSAASAPTSPSTKAARQLTLF